jgi:hypothetical protein
MSTCHIGNEISVYHLFSHLMFLMLWCIYNVILSIKQSIVTSLTSLKTSLPYICIRHHQSYVDHIEIWYLWQISEIEKYVGRRQNIWYFALWYQSAILSSNSWSHVYLYVGTSYHHNRIGDRDSDGTARSSVNRERHKQKEHQTMGTRYR